MRSLSIKLTLAFLLVGLTGSIVVALAVRWRTQQEFNQFVLNSYEKQFLTILVEYYEEHDTWDGLQEQLHAQEIYAPDIQDNSTYDGDRGDSRRDPSFTVVDDHGRVVAGPPDLIGKVINVEDATALSISRNGRVIGWMLLRPDQRWQPGTPESAFISNLTQGIAVSAVIATALALVIGILLARTISQPIRELRKATEVVASGDLGYQVPVRTTDEVGQLASSFNQMSADLARSNDLRRQMTADIAHDLRTPLSVILGYTEALSEGKLHSSPETFEVMHEEAQHLQRLIEDLRTLSLADAGELPLMRQQIAPAALLERVAIAHTPAAQQKGVSIDVQTTPDLPEIEVDPDRMVQVLGNLVSNALRYTPREGSITLSAAQQGDGIVMSVSDSGAGISPEDLPHIFERFYRADKSRYVQEGESGLGLAIARSIVQAHGGTISAESTPGEGSTFRVVVPVAVT